MELLDLGTGSSRKKPWGDCMHCACQRRNKHFFGEVTCNTEVLSVGLTNGSGMFREVSLEPHMEIVKLR